jgi:outer membrane protein TolC
MRRPFLQICLLSALLSSVQANAQTDDILDSSPSGATDNASETTTELTDGPQTLPSATESTPTPSTEVIKSSEEPLPDEISAPEAEAIPVPPTKTLQEKTGVVSEEELFKTKKKKEDSKVKSSKVSESEIYIQEADKYKLKDDYKNLQLNDVIEQGLRKNYDQNLRVQRQEVIDIQYSGAKDAFWLPELKITLTTNEQKVGTFYKSEREPLVPHSPYPAGTLGFSMGEYTVFNWGKDYALYLNTKATYDRSKQILDESKRELKLDLIGNYFSLVAFKSIERVRQDQLRQASFVYRLSKEKITVGKTTKQDYYQARSEYLKAQNDYHEAKIVADSADENMAFLIADPVGSKYVINEMLEYRRLKLTIDEAFSFAEKTNPTILNNRLLIANAERSYDVALKEQMPLPKFSVNLGAYNKRFGNGVDTTRYETYGGSGNIEMVATINATWTLVGADGFLNSNKLATSRLTRDIAVKELEKNNHFAQSFVRETYKTILSLQNQIVILEARMPSLQKTFDTVLENYLAGRAKFYDFSMALEDLTNTKIFYEQTKLQHLTEKLNLAKAMGLEDFPGENFELLASRVKGK